jgi:hypothetical protein
LETPGRVGLILIGQDQFEHWHAFFLLEQHFYFNKGLFDSSMVDFVGFVELALWHYSCFPASWKEGLEAPD